MATGALVWDATGERYYETGCSRGVYYGMNAEGTYDDGVAWNGLTSVSDTPGGAEPTDLYADDIKYASMRSAETFGGTIEAYTYPEEFGESDGSAMAVAGVYLHQQTRKPFGFCYTTKMGNDINNANDSGWEKIHIIWNATVSPSEVTHNTINDSPEAETMSWEYTTTPVVVGGKYKPVSCMTIHTKALSEENLKKLTDKLYGTASTAPTLPTPKEIIELMGGTVAAA